MRPKTLFRRRFSPCTSTWAPSVAVVGYAAVYAAAMLALALRAFNRRDL